MNSITQATALIAKGSTGDAATVSSSLDEIVKLMQVNRQHLDLFLSLYLKFLDRFFGEDVARSGEPAVANSSWTKGTAGGWLKALGATSVGGAPDGFKLPQSTPHPLGRNINATHLESLPFPLCALVAKFSPGAVVFDILSRIQGGCEIKSNLLPTKLQMFLAEHALYSYAQSRYHQYLMYALLKNNLNSSSQRNNVMHKGTLLLDATEYFFVCLLRYPSLSNAQLSTDRTTDSMGRAIAGGGYGNTASSRSSVTDTLQNKGIITWIRGNPYLTLLQEYLREYVPITFVDAANPTIHGTTETMSVEQEGQRRRYCELFLHLAVAYWIDVALVIKSEHSKLGLLRKQLAGGPTTVHDPHAEAFVVERPHPSPVELELLDPSSMRWTVGTLQCTYLLLLRVLADPSLLRRVDEAADLGEAHGLTPAASAYRRAPAMHNRHAGALTGQPAWLLLQTPLFDMLKCIFVKGDANNLDPQIVTLAMEIWLLWLQPWTALPILNSTSGVLPTRTALPQYTTEWRPYIAANLHFYTTLFVCFFKFVARSPLSLTDPDGSRLLFMLERVLIQVYTGPLVNSINSLTDAFHAWYVPNHQHPHLYAQDTLLRSSLRGTPFTPTVPFARAPPRTEGYTSATTPEAAAGVGLGGGFRGAAARGAQASLQEGDEPVTTSMLHLMQLQHVRLFPDRRIDDLEDCGITDIALYAEQAGVSVVSQLHQMNQSPDTEQDLAAKLITSIATSVRSMFGLPPEEAPRGRHYDRLERDMAKIVQMIPGAVAGREAAPAGAALGGAAGAGTNDGEERIRDERSGKLTEFGKQQLLSGRDKCRVQDLLEPRALTKDPLELPICSYEWPFLARMLIALSAFLNARLQLPVDNQQMMCSWPVIVRRARQRQPAGDHLYPLKVAVRCFRFNLRGLAAYRTSAAVMWMLMVAAFYLQMLSLPALLALSLLFGYIAYENGVRLE